MQGHGSLGVRWKLRHGGRHGRSAISAYRINESEDGTKYMDGFFAMQLRCCHGRMRG
jgi:hypothetical protein